MNHYYYNFAKIFLHIFVFALVLPLMSCNNGLQKSANQIFYGDEESLKDNATLKKYPVIFEFDRKQYGLSDLPEKAKVGFTEQKNQIIITIIKSDITKHIYLAKNDAGEFTVLQSEKEEFTGLNTYKGKYVNQKEVIVINYTDFKSSCKSVQYEYYGEGPTLNAKKFKLTLEDIEPYLKKMGLSLV